MSTDFYDAPLPIFIGTATHLIASSFRSLIHKSLIDISRQQWLLLAPQVHFIVYWLICFAIRTVYAQATH